MSWRYGGNNECRALKASSPTLNWILCLMGSQWRERVISVALSDQEALVTVRASKFWTCCKTVHILIIYCVLWPPYTKEQTEMRNVKKNCTDIVYFLSSVIHAWSILILQIPLNNKKRSYCTDSAQCSHSRSLKVIRCCANRCGVYDFLLALNSNLTSIFNRSWDITPNTPHFSSRWNWIKTARSR